MLPPELRGDFQDLPTWRSGVVEALETTLRGHEGLVIAPQTVVDKEYFREIVGSLRSRGHDVRHVTLMARPETVIQRLQDRGFGRLTARLGRDPLAREAFAVERVMPYLDRLQDPAFAEHVWTDDLTLAQVADRAAAACDVALRPADEGRVRTSLRRAATTVRHMRNL